MADKAERKAAARKAKRQMRDIKRGMTPAELESFRAKEKEMREDQPSRLDRPKIKVISPEERAKRRKKAQEKRERRNIAKQLEAPSARDLERGKRRAAKKKRQDIIKALNMIADLPERESGSLEEFDRIYDNEAATERKPYEMPREGGSLKGLAVAKGGKIKKKYGYMGGGKVYGQPRKAKYTAG